MEEGIDDVYSTIGSPSVHGLYKEKGSKFLGLSFPVSNRDQIDSCLSNVKKEHAKARHWCYAWRLGVETPEFRYNDDGEPGNSAGKPIYGQIQSFGLTNVLIIVVRYFGGTKLGVGGLISAYRAAAKDSLEQAVIVQKIVSGSFSVRFQYADMDKVMRIIKEEDISIEGQKMDLDCEYTLSVRKGKLEQVENRFLNLRCVSLKRIT
ncbi:IMPACT family protein [Lutimonas zeaxanthinifaciens]|uniref:IMPACT family protein n=1 Tax=Lutimonas zeaxanthinifaciens TaxID=3060215 RepID=UPI00265CDBF3|nr:YigZ family protein [Lutimonas sp. YSD2104]WKK65036.1 YigZ family protein [Lutimonas sp. YSD2104]